MTLPRISCTHSWRATRIHTNAHAHVRYAFDEEEAAARARFEEAERKRASEGKLPVPRPGTESGVKTKLQELGPRFTLKMRWLQQGSFDTKFGEYEWLGKRGGIGLQEKRTQFNL